MTVFAAAVMLAGSVPLTAFASEQTENVDLMENTAADSGSEGENEGQAEGDVQGEAEGQGETPSGNEVSQGSVVMSGLPSNNGREIAAQFPEDYIPEGFHKSTCTYEGQTIEIAYMDKGNGEVVLAYLADADGSNGDFYLCDINTAEMSDFVQIYGNEGNYIIVLDPRDMIVAPGGFTKANLQWYGKSVSAWLLPNSGAAAKEDSSESAGISSVPALFEACAGAGRTMTVYASAGEAAVGTDRGQETEPLADEGQEEDPAADTKSAGTAEPEDGSGVVEADPSQFFLVYAINQDGIIGFYLYDTAESTYQRYVSIDTGDGAVTEQYRTSAQRRLIVIAVLAVALVISLFVMINLILKQREGEDGYEEDEDEDEEDEMEQMRRRVAKKEKSHIRTGRRELNYLMDIDEEEEEEEDEEDEEDFEQIEMSFKTQKKPAPAASVRRMPVKEAPVKEAEKPVAKPAPKAAPKPAPKKEPKPDLDEDFEFEFLDI